MDAKVRSTGLPAKGIEPYLAALLVGNAVLAPPGSAVVESFGTPAQQRPGRERCWSVWIHKLVKVGHVAVAGMVDPSDVPSLCGSKASGIAKHEQRISFQRIPYGLPINRIKIYVEKEHDLYVHPLQIGRASLEMIVGVVQGFDEEACRIASRPLGTMLESALVLADDESEARVALRLFAIGLGAAPKVSVLVAYHQLWLHRCRG